LAITFEPETLESPSNPLKTRTVAKNSKKTLSQKIGSIGRLPGDDDVIQM